MQMEDRRRHTLLCTGSDRLVLCRRLDDFDKAGKGADSGKNGRRTFCLETGEGIYTGICVFVAGWRSVVYWIHAEQSF